MGLEKVAPKLQEAVVDITNSSAIKIIVANANVYDDIYQASVALQKGDVTSFGFNVGLLVEQLQAADCQTKACLIIIGLLQSVQLEAQDFENCASKFDKAWNDINKFIDDLEKSSFGDAVSVLEDVFTSLAETINDCDIPKLGDLLENVANKLGSGTTVAIIEEVVQVLVEGSDVTLYFDGIIQDAKAGRWKSFGQDLGDMSSKLQGECKSFVCLIVQGLLSGTGILFEHIQDCEADLRDAEKYFTQGASSASKGIWSDVLAQWSKGLSIIASSTSDCGVSDELSWIQQEANVLGLGNVTLLGSLSTIIIHGADFYQDIYDAYLALLDHDYRKLGEDTKTILDALATWTHGHSCTNNFCYVVVGILQFLGEIEGDIKNCESDFKNAFHNFTGAVELIVNETDGNILHFSRNKKHLEQGIHDIGQGFNLIAKGVTDCHLQELAIYCLILLSNWVLPLKFLFSKNFYTF